MDKELDYYTEKISPKKGNGAKGKTASVAAEKKEPREQASAESGAETEIIGVRFKDVGKVYYFSPNGIDFKRGDKDIELAIRTGRFLREWHDINRFENSLPKNYFKAQLYAWLEMRRHPLWLEHWQDVCIEDARWNSAEGKAVLRIAATGESGMIRCGIRREPERIGFSGGKMSWKSGGTFLLIETAGSGILTLSFGKPAENAGARV